ncbi:carboxymuconolactone decarboxylase family protein (plasmid) [Rhodococcus sp. USK10]|uniref:carboxymuconolactone decarboxylase family protein n=1 Tax=Rhodococcus sp. USK10 TaxID=2789739 RepID=UPI001C5D78C3|nr:carboxymuconolactone decarboxylase family protein [Rhodococcus sp. USK10]QYB00193.1 carboxymuconolactone decarboxylase family protein [Rhodococcus sp. USK10]
MALVPYVDPDQLNEDDRDLLARPINLSRAIANNPKALRAFSVMPHWVRYQTELDSRLRELAILHIGYLLQSDYEFSHHLQLAQEFGATKADITDLIAAIEGRPHGLGATEQLVLRFATEVTVDGKAQAQTWADVEDKLGREQAIELLLIVSFFNNVARILATLDVDVEPEWASYLEQFPMPAKR